MHMSSDYKYSLRLVRAATSASIDTTVYMKRTFRGWENDGSGRWDDSRIAIRTVIESLGSEGKVFFCVGSRMGGTRSHEDDFAADVEIYRSIIITNLLSCPLYNNSINSDEPSSKKANSITKDDYPFHLRENKIFPEASIVFFNPIIYFSSKLHFRTLFSKSFLLKEHVRTFR